MGTKELLFSSTFEDFYYPLLFLHLEHRRQKMNPLRRGIFNCVQKFQSIQITLERFGVMCPIDFL